MISKDLSLFLNLLGGYCDIRLNIFPEWIDDETRYIRCADDTTMFFMPITSDTPLLWHDSDVPEVYTNVPQFDSDAIGLDKLMWQLWDVPRPTWGEKPVYIYSMWIGFGEKSNTVVWCDPQMWYYPFKKELGLEKV